MDHAESLKRKLVEDHKELMNGLSPEKRKEVQKDLDKMISDANKKSGNHAIMKDFTSEILGK